MLYHAQGTGKARQGKARQLGHTSANPHLKRRAHHVHSQAHHPPGTPGCVVRPIHGPEAVLVRRQNSTREDHTVANCIWGTRREKHSPARCPFACSPPFCLKEIRRARHWESAGRNLRMNASSKPEQGRTGKTGKGTHQSFELGIFGPACKAARSAACLFKRQ